MTKRSDGRLVLLGSEKHDKKRIAPEQLMQGSTNRLIGGCIKLLYLSRNFVLMFDLKNFLSVSRNVENINQMGENLEY